MKDSLLPPPPRQNKKATKQNNTAKTAVVRFVRVPILVEVFRVRFFFSVEVVFAVTFQGLLWLFNLGLPKIFAVELLMLASRAVFPFHEACSIAFILANCQNTVKETEEADTDFPALYEAILCIVEFSTVFKNCEFASAKS